MIMLVVIFLVVLFVFTYYIIQVQIVNAEYYKTQANKKRERIVTSDALRGEIIDTNGKALVQNDTTHDIILDMAFFETKEEQNTIILKLVDLLKDNNLKWFDSLPISNKPNENNEFVFLEKSDDGKSLDKKIKQLKKDASLQDFATAEHIVEKLVEIYSIDVDLYSREQIRTIIGVRYEMILNSFSESNPYTFAHDIPFNLVMQISESLDLTGVFIEEVPKRQYVSNHLAPHVIGMVGPIYPEELEKYSKENGYNLNDEVGKSGIEYAFEDKLKGTNGKKKDFLNPKAKIIDPNNTEIVKETIPGNTVKLTMDIDLQQVALESLQRNIHYLRTSPTVKEGEGKEADVGSAVAIHIPTGKILAAASFPSYDVNDYRNKYTELSQIEQQPLFNRAFDGLYAPGSCFKPVTALAGMMEGLTTPESTYFCGHVFNVFSDYKPKCLGSHGNFNVVNALTKSCNIYFYNVGYNMGTDEAAIDKLANYANMLGLGVPTGIEFENEKIGHTANSESVKAVHGVFNPSDIVQASIGQSVNMFTPLQLANYTSALARDGVLMEAHIVEQILDYNQENVIEDYKKVEISRIEGQKEAFDTIREGMILASSWSGTSGRTFGNYPIVVASKTGTPQTDEFPNSVYIAYAPADKPEIAVAVILEKGWHGYTGAPVARDIFDYYFFSKKDESKPPEIDYSEPKEDAPEETFQS